MEVTYDLAKNATNVRKHRISLNRAEDFDFAAAVYVIDDREDYGEVRYRAISFIDGRLYSLVFTQDGDAIRAISLRKASKYEEEEYRQA
jgi:uncharacterized DUF497 family protein